jgi:hypothetical protein
MREPWDDRTDNPTKFLAIIDQERIISLHGPIDQP